MIPQWQRGSGSAYPSQPSSPKRSATCARIRRIMKPIFVLGLVLLAAQIPKNDPNGIWESESGSKYSLKLSGSDLHVQILEGSNPRFLKYEVDLKSQSEVNTYKGTGYFIAKLENGKECKFETDWEFIVVTPDRILGSSTNIVPDSQTCAIKQRGRTMLDLKKT